VLYVQEFFLLNNNNLKMQDKILNGKQLSVEILDNLKPKIKLLKQNYNIVPGLAVILVGCDPASQIYVQRKHEACLNNNIESKIFKFDNNITEQELIDLIKTLNIDSNIHGILVQLPLPSHINQLKIIETISPYKDIDGFHPYNMGRLAIKKPLIRPCTPKGIIRLLKHYNINLSTKHAVIIGASNIVGRPLALEFLMQGATTTVCHKSTDKKDLELCCKNADILCTATGVIDIIPTEWIKPDSIVIDIGINRLENGKIRGDINFDKALPIVKYITPVPGGIGPMTVAMLLENTYESAVNGLLIN
tara:strand:- start:8239 stop:9153 length:915 start_codon:yes stop_codon:yes gene_type:complete